MNTTIFEAVGGAETLLRLSEATHRRCLADPDLNHPFAHPGNHPDHVARVAAYWGEVLGGPAAYSEGLGSESHAQRLHAGEGAYTEQVSPAFLQCILDSYDEAGVPADDEVRAALTGYFTWAVFGPFQAYPASADDVPDDLAVPRWSWSGRVDPAD